MQNLFRKLPKVDILMKDEKLLELKKNLNYSSFYKLISDEIENYRKKIKNREIDDFEVSDIIESILKNSSKYNESNLKRVVNGTGVIIHTNLGRSLISRDIIEKVSEIGIHYNNLEYNIQGGLRSNRNLHVESLL